VNIPASLLAHAGIEKEVVVTGVHDHLELWSAEGWTEQQAMLDQVMGEVTDSLGDPS
jgi:DNA-binding transcriptional regulator/RsmH inhibitor MraZ